MNKEDNIYGLIANTVGINARSYLSESWLPYLRELSAKQTEGPFDAIDIPSNTNRTILKIIDTGKPEPIKAKAYYDSETGEK